MQSLHPRLVSNAVGGTEGYCTAPQVLLFTGMQGDSGTGLQSRLRVSEGGTSQAEGASPGEKTHGEQACVWTAGV